MNHSLSPAKLLKLLAIIIGAYAWYKDSPDLELLADLLDCAGDLL